MKQQNTQRQSELKRKIAREKKLTKAYARLVAPFWPEITAEAEKEAAEFCAICERVATELAQNAPPAVVSMGVAAWSGRYMQ